MIIDAHAHYIEASRPDRPYVDPSPMHPISFDQLAAAAAKAGVDLVVQVTASTMGYDNRYSFEGAKCRPDKIAGVFGRFDPLVSEVEAKLKDYFAQPNALGIRLTLFHSWAQTWLPQRALDPFLRAAAKMDVPIAIFAPFQNELLLETIRRHPDVRFLVDHMGIRVEPAQTPTTAFRQWNSLLELAQETNVWVKVSYFPEAMLGSEGYPYRLAQQHFERLVQHAGTSRLIWGSNFPPVGRACTYLQALDFVQKECEFLSAQDRALILGGNFYRDFMR